MVTIMAFGRRYTHKEHAKRSISSILSPTFNGMRVPEVAQVCFREMGLLLIAVVNGQESGGFLQRSVKIADTLHIVCCVCNEVSSGTILYHTSLQKPATFLTIDYSYQQESHLPKANLSYLRNTHAIKGRRQNRRIDLFACSLCV